MFDVEAEEGQQGIAEGEKQLFGHGPAPQCPRRGPEEESRCKEGDARLLRAKSQDMESEDEGGGDESPRRDAFGGSGEGFAPSPDGKEGDERHHPRQLHIAVVILNKEPLEDGGGLM